MRGAKMIKVGYEVSKYSTRCLNAMQLTFSLFSEAQILWISHACLNQICLNLITFHYNIAVMRALDSWLSIKKYEYSYTYKLLLLIFVADEVKIWQTVNYLQLL